MPGDHVGAPRLPTRSHPGGSPASARANSAVAASDPTTSLWACRPPTATVDVGGPRHPRVGRRHDEVAPGRDRHHPHAFGQLVVAPAPRPPPTAPTAGRWPGDRGRATCRPAGPRSQRQRPAGAAAGQVDGRGEVGTPVRRGQGGHQAEAIERRRPGRAARRGPGGSPGRPASGPSGRPSPWGRPPAPARRGRPGGSAARRQVGLACRPSGRRGRRPRTEPAAPAADGTTPPR